MSLTIDIRPMPDYLRATMTGDYETEGFKSAYVRILDAAHQHKRVKILVDCLGMRGNPTYLERKEFGQFAISLRFEALLAGKTSGFETAFVALPPFVDPDMAALQEARRRGLKSTVCSTVEDALAFLGVRPDSAG